MLSVNSMRKWVFAIISVAVVSLSSGCGGNADKAAAPVRKNTPPEEGKDIEGYMSEGALVKGKLTAPYMLRFQKVDSPYSEFPRSLHVDFYNAAKVIESQLDARYGKQYQNQGKVYLRDSVVVKNVLKGDTVHCQELWWDQQTQRFYTDKPVRINTKDKTLFGTGMEADQNFQWYHITHLTGSLLTSQNAMPK